MDLSYCVVNTNGREHLLACLRAIRELHPEGLSHEVLVLDNASEDGSVEAVAEWNRGPAGLGEGLRLIARDRRGGKAENDTLLLREASAELCLLLNEDSELRPGAPHALVAALRDDPGAAAAGALLLGPGGEPQACAWRLPGVGTALAQALFLHRRLVVQSGGTETAEVGWVQSAAMLVRRSAAQEVGWLDPAFFVYSDETDFCKRLHDAGWRILHVPRARATHHEQLATDPASGARRAVEFHRNRDLYMAKHASAGARIGFRLLSALAYAVRALGALAMPGQSFRWYRLHARSALRPWRAEGLREAAEEHNRRLTARQAREAAEGR